MICAILRFLFLTLALSVALVFLLPASLLAGGFYALAAVFEDRSHHYWR